MKSASVMAWLALWCVMGATTSSAQPVEAPVGCGGQCLARMIERGPVEAPVGCGGLCLSGDVPQLTASVANPSEVGCGGYCATSDFPQQVAALGFPLKVNGVAESLSFALSDTPDGPPIAPAFEVGIADLASLAARIDTALRICTSSADAPISVWREALVQRPALLACEKAARPLLEQREDNAEAYFAFLGGAVTRQDSTFKELFRTYKEACLQPLEQYQGALAFRSLFGPKFAEQLRDNVGTLVGRNGSSGFECTASIVKLSEAPKKVGLLTAAHCIGATRSMGSDSSQIESVFKSLVFTSLSGRKMGVRVNDDVRGWIYPLRHDLAIVPASTDATNDVQGVPMGNPSTLKGWDPLYLVGVNPIVMALANAERTSANEIPPVQATTITLSTPCRVVGLDQGRLVHNCETEKQMSGSPIFAISNGSPAIVAVHTGGDDAPSPLAVCGSSSWPAINQAVIVPR